MTYQEVLDFLFTQFPQYQKIGGAAYKPGLVNIKTVCEYLGNPQQDLKIIHVAGTNGKGSTCSMLSSVLQTAGFNVGLFTSPHLIDFRERIRINGIEISEAWVIDFVEKHQAFLKSMNASFFEWTTALAFTYFRENKVDYVVLETGLGGRLDATNIVKPIISVITSIGIDHTQYLGNTIEAIAKEKGGIIKPNTPIVLSSANSHSVIEVIKNIAKQNNAEFYTAQESELECDLKGDYQKFNKGTVLKTLEVIGITDKEIIEKGLRNTIQNTKFRGRWEILSTKPKTIADIGHNFSGISQIVSQLQKEHYTTLHIVWGMVADKEIEKIASILPQNAVYYLSEPQIQRAFPKAEWVNYFDDSYKFEIFDNLSLAYQKALNNSHSDDLIFIGGSNFVVAEIISHFFN